MFGLIVSDPHCNTAQREALRTLLYALDLPLTAFTEEPAPLFAPKLSRAAFLRRASAALLIPGQLLPLEDLLEHLSATDPLPGNVLRRHLFLQFSLLPYLRPGRKITHFESFFLLGDALLIVPVSPEDTVDVQLPPGTWTELTGQLHERRLRCMRGYQETPILVRENTLLPIGVHDRSADHDDADRLTLHWFQPGESAECILLDGARYQVQRVGEHISLHANTDKPFHLILHENGTEQLIR